VALRRGHGGFRRTVAVKRIHADLARDRRFRELFTREAMLSSRIGDPGVVQVLELLEERGELLLVMELVEGVSLRTLMDALPEGGRVDVAIAAHVVSRAARALHAAHAATDDTGARLGLVHRDVSPQNVLLSFRGDVKVTDFGIAKAVSADDPATTTVRGKPAYFSPEQGRGRPVDARTDVWSLGVVAFELLTGQRLFKGRNDLETLERVLNGPIPRADALREEVPRGLADVVERALLRNPESRWSTAAEMADAIEDVAERLPRVRRADVEALVARCLPSEEEAFNRRLQGALAAERAAPSDPPPEVPAAPVRPLRFAGLVAAGFALALGGSQLSSTAASGDSGAAIRDAPSAEPAPPAGPVEARTHSAKAAPGERPEEAVPDTVAEPEEGTATDAGSDPEEPAAARDRSTRTAGRSDVDRGGRRSRGWPPRPEGRNTRPTRPESEAMDDGSERFVEDFPL